MAFDQTRGLPLSYLLHGSTHNKVLSSYFFSLAVIIFDKGGGCIYEGSGFKDNSLRPCSYRKIESFDPHTVSAYEIV